MGLKRVLGLLGGIVVSGWFLGQAGVAEITLAWDPSPTPTTTGYRIYCGPSPGRYVWSTAVGKTTARTLTFLATEGRTYYFVVRAHDQYGNESGPSNEVPYLFRGKTPTSNLLSSRGVSTLLPTFLRTDESGFQPIAARDPEGVSWPAEVDGPKISQIARAGDVLLLVLDLPAGKPFTVRYCEDLVSGQWQSLRSFPPLTEPGRVVVTDEPGGSTVRVYQIELPADDAHRTVSGVAVPD